MQTNPSAPSPQRLIRLPEVESIVGLKKSAIYSAVREGKFPAPIKLSRRAVCWNSQAIDAWVLARINGGAA
jgi:prophage regulatory protein